MYIFNLLRIEQHRQEEIFAFYSFVRDGKELMLEEIDKAHLEPVFITWGCDEDDGFMNATIDAWKERLGMKIAIYSRLMAMVDLQVVTLSDGIAALVDVFPVFRFL